MSDSSAEITIIQSELHLDVQLLVHVVCLMFYYEIKLLTVWLELICDGRVFFIYCMFQLYFKYSKLVTLLIFTTKYMYA